MAILGALLLDAATDVVYIGDARTNVMLEAAAARSGGNCIRTINVNAAITVNLSAQRPTLYVAAAFKNTQGVIRWYGPSGASDNCRMSCNADGSVTLLGNGAALNLYTSPPGLVSSEAWTHIEAYATIHNTAGAMGLWINGTEIIQLSGVDTLASQNGTTLATTQLVVYPGPGTTSRACDIIWADARIGDRTIKPLVLTGAGNYSQWAPSTGINYDNIHDTNPDEDVTYNDTPTVGAIDTFSQAGLSSTPSAIDAVVVQIRAKNDIAGTGSVAPTVRSGTMDAVGDEFPLNVGYATKQSVWNQDPATSAAWSKAGVDAMEPGYKRLS